MRKDPLWNQEPVDIEVRPGGMSVFRLRLPTSEFHALCEAARQTGVSVSDYIRQSLAMRQPESSVAVTTVNVSHAYTTIHYQQ